VLTGTDGELRLEVVTPVTVAGVLDALESRFPVLTGALRDRSTGRRRPFIRFFAGETDMSNAPPATPLPGAVTEGREVFFVVGAMAGG
jgi:hypothetical protein